LTDASRDCKLLHRLVDIAIERRCSGYNGPLGEGGLMSGSLDLQWLDDMTATINFAAAAALDELNDVYFFVKDADRRFIYCNRPFVVLMGLSSRNQLIGKRDEDISPEYLVEHYRQHDLQVLRQGTKIVGLVELVHAVDGSYDWFTTTKFPLRNCQNDVVGIAGLTRSLTKRNVVEEPLRSLTPAVEMIARDYGRPLTVKELAASVSMSPSYFARSFKQQLGTTPHKYIRKVRLVVACELLSTTDLPIATIASRTGYYDQSHLSNDVLRERGMTAGRYRNCHRRPPEPDQFSRSVKLNIRHLIS
jgi:PAS domain S-box-containing protein